MRSPVSKKFLSEHKGPPTSKQVVVDRAEWELMRLYIKTHPTQMARFELEQINIPGRDPKKIEGFTPLEGNDFYCEHCQTGFDLGDHCPKCNPK